MHALGNGGLHLGRTKVRRRAEQDDIDARFQQLLMAVEADKLVIVIDGDLVGDVLLALQVLQGQFQAIRESIRHPDQLDVLVGSQSLSRSPRTATAAPDDPDSNYIIARSVNRAGMQSRHGPDSGQRPSLEELAAGRGWSGHRILQVGTLAGRVVRSMVRTNACP
jgi:hypothetical protein